MSKFKKYQNTALLEMRAYVPGENLDTVAFSPVNYPLAGGMIARDPDNHENQWYVSEKYFRENYKEVKAESDCPETVGMNFGWAICQLKAGNRVRRAGWNGKGMYLILLPGGDIPKTAIHDPALRAVMDQECPGDTFPALPSIRMWTVNSEGRRAILTGWLASQTDMIEEDWELVE